MDNWLNEDLKKRVRQVFEPKYKRVLTDQEVISIALNLTDFIEHFLKFKWRANHETRT